MNTRDTEILTSRFFVGELIHHKKFDYRGVIVDVDPDFQLSDEWYDQVAVSRPRKDQPWYHVLVHNSSQMTYVAEGNLEADNSGKPIIHPLVNEYFSRFARGRYQAEKQVN